MFDDETKNHIDLLRPTRGKPGKFDWLIIDARYDETDVVLPFRLRKKHRPMRTIEVTMPEHRTIEKSHIRWATKERVKFAPIYRVRKTMMIQRDVVVGGDADDAIEIVDRSWVAKEADPAVFL